MITKRTKVQLLVFVLITMLGVAYVGGKYAKLDRLFFTTDYKVTTQLTDSGGIFKGSEVSYRGTTIGQVCNLQLTRAGVDAILCIDRSHKRIPSDVEAIVANKSAIGEQYIDLEPRTDAAPYLKAGSTIPSKDTQIPISTATLLTNVDQLVNSVNQDDLKTTVHELGTGFKGAGPSLAQILDTSTSFIKTANANFDTTTALITDAKTVLQTQADKARAINASIRNLSLFSGTLAANDKALRKVIDNGGATAQELRDFLDENGVDLGALLNNLVTTGNIVVKHLHGIRQILVIYPYVVEGSYSVVGKGPDGHYDAQFGLILTPSPDVCTAGYGSTKKRTPQQTSDEPMNTKAHCSSPASQTNARGAAHAPNGRAATDYRAPTVATYDSRTGKVHWTDRAPGSNVTYTGGAEDTFGKDSWKWLLLQPVAAGED